MPRLSDIQKAQRRNQIVELDAMGLTQREIAKEIGTSVGTVNKDLQDARAHAFAHSTIVPSNKIVMIKRLHFIIKEAFEAWKASQDHARKESATTRKNKKGDPTSVTEHVEEVWRDGNPAFLNVALGAIRELQELLGFKRTGDDNVLIQAQIIWTTEQSEALRLQAGDDFDYVEYFDYLDELAKLDIIQGPGEIIVEGEVVDD